VEREGFRLERRFAWEKEIEPALAELDRLSHGWAPADVALLKQSRKALADLKEIQWWIEDLAHTPGNTPARTRLMSEIEPVVKQITRDATELITDTSAPLDFRLSLANFLAALTDSRAALGQFADEGGKIYLESHLNQFAESKQHLARLRSLQGTLTREQERLLASVVKEFEAYKVHSDTLVKARPQTTNNRAHHLLQSRAVPLAEQATQMLSRLATNQEALLRRDAARVIRLMTLEVGLSVGLIAVMVLAALILSNRGARRIAEPISELSEAARNFREDRVVTDADSERTDEIGELSRSLLALQKEVMHSETELRLRNLELAHSNRDLERFASAASHDLQEPLRMVASYTRLLKKRYHGKLDEDADEFIDYAVDGALRMQSMVQGILKLARVGRGEKNFEPVDANEVVQLALHDLESVVDEKQPEIEVGELPTVCGDRAQLVQLFQNLIGNALKYCSCETPSIEISATPLSSDKWQFSVKDNGIGFAQSDAKRIFAVFQRLHTSEEAFKGTGIGLSLCQSIVEYHGGEIWAESEPGKGSTFHFSLKAS